MGLTIEQITSGPPYHFVGQAIGDAGDSAPEFHIVKVTFDSSYPTGGEDFGLSDFLGGLPHVMLEACTSGGYVARWDRANGKLMLFYGDTNAVADGALIQVPNTTDVATESIRALCFGVRHA